LALAWQPAADAHVLLPADSVYVSIGRGDTTDQEALVEALQAKEGPLKIGGASLDVTTPEPLPEGHALWTLPNTIISPHCSAYSVHYFELAADLLKVNVDRLRAGKGGFNAWKGKGED
jgi:phosphoglycerate dehydrogenase-like enzyme